MKPNRVLYLLTLIYGVLLAFIYFVYSRKDFQLDLALRLTATCNGLRGLVGLGILGAIAGACSYLQSFTSLGISGALTFLFLPAFVDLGSPLSVVQAIIYGWTSLYGFSDSISLLLAIRIGKRKSFLSLLKYVAISSLASSLILIASVLMSDLKTCNIAFPKIYSLLPSVIGIPLLSLLDDRRRATGLTMAFSLNVSSLVFSVLNRLLPILSPLGLFFAPVISLKLLNNLEAPKYEVEELSPADLLKSKRRKRKGVLVLSTLFSGITAHLDYLFFLISVIGLFGIVVREISLLLFLRGLKREGIYEIEKAETLLESGDVESSILMVFPWFIRLLSQYLDIKPHELRYIGDSEGGGISRLIWAALNPSEAGDFDAREMLAVLRDAIGYRGKV